MVSCCKLSWYSKNGLVMSMQFLAMIEMMCHVNHFFDLWQLCNLPGIEQGCEKVLK